MGNSSPGNRESIMGSLREECLFLSRICQQLELKLAQEWDSPQPPSCVLSCASQCTSIALIAVFKILLVAEQSSVWREIPLWQWQECLPPWGPERHLLLVLQSLFPSPSQSTPFLGRFSSSSGYIYSILMTGSS